MPLGSIPSTAKKKKKIYIALPVTHMLMSSSDVSNIFQKYGKLYMDISYYKEMFSIVSCRNPAVSVAGGMLEMVLGECGKMYTLAVITTAALTSSS